MPFNLNQFRSQLVLDGARPNLFDVTLTLPSFATGTAATTAQTTLNFMIKSAQLPGSTLGVVPVFYFGREIKVPGNRTFPDWTITVINDESFAIRNAFEKWMNALNSHSGNERSDNAYVSSTYAADLKVRQYGKNSAATRYSETGSENFIKTYNFIGAFPTDISPIDLDWGSNDAIEEFTVTFAYQWWESPNTTDSTSTTAAT
jgi:hypothetical protein